MTHLLNKPAIAIDFAALYKHIDTRLEALDAFDEIYFIGTSTGSFALRAASIAKALPNFAGVAGFPITPASRIRLAEQLPLHAN